MPGVGNMEVVEFDNVWNCCLKSGQFKKKWVDCALFVDLISGQEVSRHINAFLYWMMKLYSSIASWSRLRVLCESVKVSLFFKWFVVSVKKFFSFEVFIVRVHTPHSSSHLAKVVKIFVLCFCNCNCLEP